MHPCIWTWFRIWFFNVKWNPSKHPHQQGLKWVSGLWSDLLSFPGYTFSETWIVFSTLVWIVTYIIIWLAPWAGKMNQILRCDWLAKQARWSYLARSGLPALSCKKNFPKSHVMNSLLTKLVRSRWLDIGLILFLRVYGPRLRLGQ